MASIRTTMRRCMGKDRIIIFVYVGLVYGLIRFKVVLEVYINDK